VKDDRDPAPSPSAESHAPPRKRGHRDLIAAITSGFVGALALGSSLYNVYLQRQQVSAAVWPSLEWTMTPGDNGLVFGVANRGTGPAVIKTFVVQVDGKKMRSWPEVFRALLHTGGTEPDDMSDLRRTVSAGGELTAVRITDRFSVLHTAKERRRLVFDVCYCSTLDDCWRLHVADARNQSTTVVSTCPPEAEPFEALNDRQLDYWLSVQSDDAGASPDAR
jgi:hypothetical protein